MAKVLYVYMGHVKVHSDCFDNSGTDPDSMTCVTDSTNVTVRDVCVTYVIRCFIRNSGECHMTEAIWSG